MSKSRYSTNAKLYDPTLQEPKHYATWTTPTSLQGYRPADLIAGQSVVSYVWRFGDRLDRLAKIHMGDDNYWWIIAFVNNITYPLGIKPGFVIQIPTSPRPTLERLGLV